MSHRPVSPPRILERTLLRPIPFVLGWRAMLIIGGSLGLMTVAITLLFEPFGTDQYEHPYRTLMLSGYALCTIVPVLVFHALDRWVYRFQQARWFLANELVSRPLMVLAAVTCNWWYSHRVINDIALSRRAWWFYLLEISTPYLLVLLPLAVLAALVLAWRWPEPPPDAKKTWLLEGENQGEILRLVFQDFIYAEAQQNYVAIHFLKDGQAELRLFRTTLSELERQLPQAVRVHRSYLVNPQRIEQLQGNARKRRLSLSGVDHDIPVSPSFKP